jgi:hypothetical protein
MNHLDYLGQELKVGDFVAHHVYGSQIRVSQIIALTPKRVRVKYSLRGVYGHNGEKYCFENKQLVVPDRCVIVPETPALTLKALKGEI